MTNKIILETIPIVFLYDIIQILNLVINLYYLNNCMIKGLRLYKIFFYVDGHFLCNVVFQQLYKLDDFCIMKYNSVISAISKYLKLLSIDKTSIRRLRSPCLPIYLKPILIVEKCTII